MAQTITQRADEAVEVGPTFRLVATSEAAVMR